MFGVPQGQQRDKGLVLSRWEEHWEHRSVRSLFWGDSHGPVQLPGGGIVPAPVHYRGAAF